MGRLSKLRAAEIFDGPLPGLLKTFGFQEQGVVQLLDDLVNLLAEKQLPETAGVCGLNIMDRVSAV